MSMHGAPAVAFVLLGDKHRASLRLLLMQCVSTWWLSWKASSDAIEVQVRDEIPGRDAKPGRATGDWVLARNAAGASLFAVRTSPEFMAALAGASAPAAAISGAFTADELARELRLEVVKSLCRALLDRAKTSDASMNALSAGERLPTEGHPGRMICVDVNLGAARAAVTMLLAPTLIEQFALRSTATLPQEKLSPRRAAIRDETTRVEAVLGSVEVTLRDLAKLAEGDVIVLEQPLGQAGHLTTPDGARITKIVLGRTGAQRAVSMTR